MIANGSAARSAAEIERQIAITRGNIGRALAAIDEKLTAPHLLKEGVDMMAGWFRGKEEGASGIGKAVRANSIPLVLIGAGLAWFVAANGGLGERIAQNERIQGARRRLADVAGKIGGEAAANVLAGETARGDGWLHQASGAAGDAMRSLRDSGSAAIGRAGTYAGYAGARASEASERLRTTFERYPLLIGAVGIVAGAAIATLLPSSRAEDRILGETRTALRKKADEIGRDVAERARSAIDTALAPTSRRLSIFLRCEALGRGRRAPPPSRPRSGSDGRGRCARCLRPRRRIPSRAPPRRSSCQRRGR
jgi:hypothetical protein